MRYVPVNCIRPGMILAKTLIGYQNQVLLRAGTSIKEAYIEKIKTIGVNGIYIHDNLSSDIKTEGIITEELKMKTVKGLKTMFVATQKNGAMTDANVEKMKKLVEDMVNEITDNAHLMVNMVDLKVFDDYTYYHSVNVAVLSIVMGIALKLSKKDLYELGLGALLHDIGKVFIDKDVLGKPGKLTEEEFETIKGHPMLGYEHIKNHFDVPGKACAAICQHHEKYNGLGYPSQRKGKDIFIFGRIVSVADVYDALTSDRSYRKAMLPSEAIEYIMGNSGEMFDPDLVMLFVKKVAPYPVGTCVKLSNGLIGIVVENYEDSCMRPRIKLMHPKTKESLDKFINLRNDSIAYSMTIVEIINI